MTKEDDINRRIKDAFDKYVQENRRSQNGTISEVEEARREILDILSEYAGDGDKIDRSKVRKLLREVERMDVVIQEKLEKRVEEEIEKATDRAINNTLGALGGLVAAGLLSRKVIKDRVREKMFEKNSRGVSIYDRIMNTSGNIIDRLRSTIRSGVYGGSTVNQINRELKKTFEQSAWQIRRLIMAEGMHSYRRTVGQVGVELKKEGIVNAVRIIDNRGRHPYHERHECYRLAEQDMYGWGKGVYRPEDTFIYNPHPQCTAYYQLVLNDKVLRGGK